MTNSRQICDHDDCLNHGFLRILNHATCSQQFGPQIEIAEGG